jgi:hypothetical protein
MKKFLFFIVIIAGITASAHSNDNLIINLNIGDVGAVWDFPLRNNNVGIILTLLNVEIEDRWTNIGLKFCPFTYYLWGETGTTKHEADFSLLNLCFYWNVIALDFGFYFGPFATINYAFTGENFFWNKYIFTAGLQAGFRYNMGGINYNIFSVETGYRLIDGESRYHIGVRVDLVLFGYIMGAANENSKSKSRSRTRRR